MIRLVNVGKIYENGYLALENINLVLENTGFVCILGKSGSGKSTLLNIMSGNDDYTMGKIYYENRSYTSLGKTYIINNTGYIYQDYKLIESMTVEDNLRIATELAGKRPENIAKILERVGLDGYAKSLVCELSGGQKQRVAIARALVKDVKIIFADEPTGNLDDDNSINIMNMLKELSKEKLVVMVTHDVGLCHKYADRIITLDDGNIISDSLECEIDYNEKDLFYNSKIKNNKKKNEKQNFSIKSLISISKTLYKGQLIKNHN